MIPPMGLAVFVTSPLGAVLGASFIMSSMGINIVPSTRSTLFVASPLAIMSSMGKSMVPSTRAALFVASALGIVLSIGIIIEPSTRSATFVISRAVGTFEAMCVLLGIMLLLGPRLALGESVGNSVEDETGDTSKPRVGTLLGTSEGSDDGA